MLKSRSSSAPLLQHLAAAGPFVSLIPAMFKTDLLSKTAVVGLIVSTLIPEYSEQ